MARQLAIVSASRVVNAVRECTEGLDHLLPGSTERGGLVLPQSNALLLPSEASASSMEMKQELHEALEVLSHEDTRPGVLVAPDHRMASLLQTFIARKGTEEGKIIESDDPVRRAREVQFDEHDWAGWAKSFFSWWKKIVPHPWLDTA